MIPTRERPLKAETVSDLVCLRSNKHMMAQEDEQRVLQLFLLDCPLTEIGVRTGHSPSTVLDVLARYRHANGDVLHRSKRWTAHRPRPLMEGIDYPDRASPYAGLFANEMIRPMNLEKGGRWQDRMVYGG